MSNQLPIFKALANPHRLAMLSELATHPRTSYSVQDLAHLCRISHSQASQHLSVLRSVKLVTARADGTTVWNRVAPGVMWPIRIREERI